MKQPVFNAVPAILFSLMTAFIVGVSWLLGWLGAVLGLSGFLVFCVMTFVVMVSCGYLYDYLSAGARANDRQPAARDQDAR